MRSSNLRVQCGGFTLAPSAVEYSYFLSGRLVRSRRVVLRSSFDPESEVELMETGRREKAKPEVVVAFLLVAAEHEVRIRHLDCARRHGWERHRQSKLLVEVS